MAIEQLVEDRVCTLLAGTDRQLWGPLSTHEKVRRLAAIVRRVEVGAERVRITVLRGDIDPRNALRLEQAGERLVEGFDEFTLEIPVRLKTWGGKRVIVGPDGRELVDRPHIDEALVKALARAHRWCQHLASGRVPSVADLASEAGCTKTYISQILRLAFLSTAIVEAILRGEQPRRLTLTNLLAIEIPLAWNEQHRLFGLPPAR